MTVAPAHPSTTPDLAAFIDRLDAAEPRQAVTCAHTTAQELGRWHHAVTARRDAHILTLWLEGAPAAQIAEDLGEPVETVRDILAQARTQGSWEQRQTYARRAAQEYAVEAAAEEGNLFAAQH